MRKIRGNCYAASEALFHILGGRKAGWKPVVMRVASDTHWFLMHRSGVVLDPSVKQFRKRPDYSKGKGCGFLTKKPSKKAAKLIAQLTWQFAP